MFFGGLSIKSINIRKAEKVSIRIKKPDREKVKIICCAVASFLMTLVIILNIILIVKIYVFKQSVPDVFGVFPLISLTDDSAPSIRKGELVFCEKTDGYDIVPGELVAYYTDNGREKIAVRTVGKLDGDTAVLLAPGDENGHEVSVDRIIGICALSVPLFGYIIYFISTIPGFLLCVVAPTVAVTETYLYVIRKNSLTEEDEESLLLSELEALKAERERLLEQLKGRVPKRKKKNDAVRSRRGVRANAKRRAKSKRQKRK